MVYVYGYQATYVDYDNNKEYTEFKTYDYSENTLKYTNSADITADFLASNSSFGQNQASDDDTGNTTFVINNILNYLNGQNDKQEVYTIVRKTIRISIYIIAPMMMGLATVAPTVVNLILTETWEPSVFYMRIFCYVMMLYPLNTVHQSTIKALGYSSVFLKLEVYKKIVGLLILLFTFSISVKTMAVGTLVTAVVSMLINAFPNRHIIGYTYCEFLQDIFPAILISAVMCLFVNIFDFFHWNAIITLSVQIVAGTIFYVGTSALIKMRAYEDVVEGLFQFLKKR